MTNVNIGGHGSGKAVFSFSSAGSFTHAELVTVQFGDVTVTSAYIQLDLEPNSGSKSSDAIIYEDDVIFEALETNNSVHFYPSTPNAVPKRTEWTVYAELTTSDIEPRLKGMDFDHALKNVLFIGASQDDSDVGTVVTSAYKSKEGGTITAFVSAPALMALMGVQVLAAVDEILTFNSLTKSGNGPGLEMWVSASAFSLLSET